MYAILVWAEEDTPFPVVIGPCEEISVWDDANHLRNYAHKVQVCNLIDRKTAEILIFEPTQNTVGPRITYKQPRKAKGA